VKVIGEDGLARTQRRAGCQRRLESRFGEVIEQGFAEAVRREIPNTVNSRD